MVQKSTYLTFLILGIFSIWSHANVVYTVSNGNWGQNNTWSSGSVPNAGDSIIILHDIELNQNFTTQGVINVTPSGSIQTTNTNRKLIIAPHGTLFNYGQITITKLDNNAGKIYNHGPLAVSHDLENSSILFAGQIGDTAMIFNFDTIIVNHTGQGGGNSGNFVNNAGYVYNHNYFMVDNFHNKENSLFWIDSDGWITTISNVHNDGVVDNSGTFHSTANFLNNNATITGNGGSYIMDQNFNMGTNGVATCYGDPIDICSSDSTEPGASGINHIEHYECVTVCGEYLIQLPIELLFFDVSFNQEYIEVSWETAVEINNAYFEVLKSEDGINWTVFERVYSQDPNSVTSLFYTVKDYDFTEGQVYYYKLSQFDFDGSTESFVVKAIQTKSNIQNEKINVFPNPASENLHIDLGTFSDKEVNITIINSFGQVIKSFTRSSANLENISLEHFANGMYKVLIEDKNQRLQSTTFMKNN